ncbi:MAG: hypothetical protein A3E01_02715 [Gammaproteobacteria bacterium RIFCSPHIGHO2_12_FULL_63_22]|nr:MAG: hypothetical protein A3E01_02715 [Gammaproteobacteria bacterium RIFCSPHIGHO2_12_FULL_63_22]
MGAEQSGAVAETGDKFAAITSTIGKAGGAMLAMGTAAGVATVALGSLYAAFKVATRGVEDFSGEVQAAKAEADVRAIRGGIKRAGIIGDEQADFLRQTSRIAESISTSMATIMEPVLATINDGLRLIAKMADAVETGTANLRDFFEFVSSWMNDRIKELEALPGIGLIIKEFSGLADAIRKWLGDQDQDIDQEGLGKQIDAFLGIR